MSIRFAQVIESPWTGLNPIRVGTIPPGHGTPDVFVLVETPDQTRLRIDVYTDRSLESFSFQEAALWQDWIIIGFGERLYWVPLNKSLPITITLGSYFGHLYLTDEILLAATAEQLLCFNRDGKQMWASPVLGIDGVVVNHIETDRIYGEGEWDPPHGWRPFQIRIASGELVL
jgi:hypothetical protein